MFKENRQVHQQPEASKTDIGRGLKGIVTNNPEDTAVGLMGGTPSPPDKMIATSTELQQSDPEGIISKIKNNVLKVIKTPTTIIKGGLQMTEGVAEWGELQVNKIIQQVRNLVFAAAAIPAKVWEMASSAPQKIIKKITDTRQAIANKVINIIPSNTESSAAPAAA